MAYRYGIKNTYRPTHLIQKAYGWSGSSYSAADVPSRLILGEGGDIRSSLLDEQFAYEWFQSGDVGASGYSNPPFVSGAAGRLHPLLREATGHGPARILRGYIRRAEYEVADNKSKARLYFMYNPETITRDYVSYLEQNALDPFNTVYQSGNLIAPPSILSFSFELFFDRQEEVAGDAGHPGVFVDYQFFDLVVRNVVPSDPKQSNNMIPDNGVMMVNPRDITVVFSPQITVQGRPTNASVIFEKFTHRMVPFRMRIQLQILASYFGPMRDMVEYKAEQLPAEDSIPLDGIKGSVYNISFEDVESEADEHYGSGSGGSFSGGDGSGDNGGGAGARGVDFTGQLGQANDANHKARIDALAWAYNNTNQGGPGGKHVMDAGWTNYTGADSGSNRYNLPLGADCSGLVTESYVKTGQGTVLGWNGHPATPTMMQKARDGKEKFVYVALSSIHWEEALLPGDILIRDGHVAFFVKYNESGKLVIFDAASSTSSPEVGERTISGGGYGRFTHLIRPTPFGATGSAAQASNYNAFVSAGRGVA